ncbi:hypothetical protein TrVFT333_005706 [Trichoderma virens FT-333]|nr:hypothetical protein TrVFT333_005706 [Trichoderma virens FT-333]
MDDVGQGHVVDASLAFLQKLEDDMRALNESQLDSSDSSTLDSPGGARKRRRLESSSENEASKRARTASAGQDSVVFGPAEPPRRDRSRQLPAELWHRVFSFLPPNTLGRLLRVNQLFHKYLDPASPFIISTVTHVPTTRILPTLSPDAIWRASRSLHWPTMPAPLKGKFELDMWRFACTRSCQLCGLLDTNYTTPEDSLRRCGPGNTTVSPIFSFFVNSCGNCLTETSVQEVDLLLSTSSPSFISPGLPMVFLTPDANVISPQAMRSTPVPPTVRLTKVYWPAQVDRLQEELEEVKRFGIAATEEWIKGLDVRGTEAVRDTSRWDKWFQMGGVRQMRIYSSQPRPTANKAERVERKGPDTTKPLQKPRQDIETAVRLHVSSLADEVISQWLKGHSIKGNCADFVTEVLTYVRTQFYKGAVFLTRRLTLDDMRWIFEQKIGPHTNCLQQDFLFAENAPNPPRARVTDSRLSCNTTL